jgi:calcium-binding protein CML
MNRLDIDRDGKITEHEMFRVLLSASDSNDAASNSTADQTIKKIAAGATKFGGSLSEYVKDLVRKFDRDSDGLLTIQELTDGLKKMGVNLNQKDSETLMNKFDLNRDGEVSADEILKVLQGGTPSGPSVDHIILKLAAQGSSFPTMKDYAKSLIRKFDRDNDGIITFTELCDGLSKMDLKVSMQEKQALMDRLDIDRDGRITEKEMYRVLQNAESPHKRLGGITNIVEKVLKKIASGADDSNDMREYSKKLIRKFDQNSDGLISMTELTQGLKKMNIFLTSEEREALLTRLDLDRNGEISDHELYQALSSVNISDIHALAREAADIALKKLASGAEDYGSMREYVAVLMRNFDYDNDGVITFNELCEGVKRLNVYLSLKERQALMKSLDLDANGSLS